MADEYDIEIPEQASTAVPAPDEFGAFVRSRRLQLGLTQRDLEQRTGIHRARLSRYELGERPKRLDRLAAIADALEVSATYLYSLAGVDLTGDLPPLHMYLRSKYGSRLPPEALERIEAYSQRIAHQYGVNTGPALGEDE